jgi:hypothetical protein
MKYKAFGIRKAEKYTTCSNCREKIKESTSYIACYAGYLKRVLCLNCLCTLLTSTDFELTNRE